MRRAEREEQRHSATPRGRLHEVDALKAVAIVTVVLIHSIRSPWNPHTSGMEHWIGQLTRFAVPAFFAASGYLYTTLEDIPLATTLRRLRRILLPYFVASFGAQVFWALHGQKFEFGSLLHELVFCASFGPYYFVFVMLLFVLIAPLFARLRGRGLMASTLLLLIVEGMIEARLLPMLPIFWHIRNPFLWLGYFALGWWARTHRERLVEGIRRHRARLAGLFPAVFLTLVAATAAPLPPWLEPGLAWLGILAAIASGFVLTAGVDRLPAGFRWLSEASYTIYLFHLFFVLPVREYWPLARGSFEPEKVVVYWFAGVAGSALLAELARRLLGRARSRAWLGA